MYRELNNLLEKARQGDLESKEEILNRLRPLIIRKIQKYYYNKEQFQDLVQEGYETVLECIKDYDEKRGVHFLGYVKTMLKYKYLDKHKERTYASLNTPIGEDKEDEWIDLLESGDKEQVEVVIDKETNDELREALLTLTNRQREVTLLFYIKGLSMKEIAERLGISYRTVVNTKTRALEKLREQLKA